jgi:hypothetical protein
MKDALFDTRIDVGGASVRRAVFHMQCPWCTFQLSSRGRQVCGEWWGTHWYRTYQVSTMPFVYAVRTPPFFLLWYT